MYGYVSECDSARESRMNGFIAYVMRTKHPEAFGFDQWVLTLALATIIGYLYFRSFWLVIIAFVVYRFFETLLFVSLCFATRTRTSYVARSYYLGHSQWMDVLVMLCSLFLAWYIIDYSVIGAGAGHSLKSVMHHSSQLTSITVLAVTLLTSWHWRIYFWSVLAILSTVWFMHFFVTQHDNQQYSRWVAERATFIVLFFYVGFVRPIVLHYFNNFVFTFLAAVFFTSLYHWIKLQD